MFGPEGHAGRRSAPGPAQASVGEDARARRAPDVKAVAAYQRDRVHYSRVLDAAHGARA